MSSVTTISLSGHSLYALRTKRKLNKRSHKRVENGLLLVKFNPHHRTDLLSSMGHEYEATGGGHMDNGEISDRWAPAQVMELLGAKVQFKYYRMDPKFKENIDDSIKNVIGKRAPWPHKDSVFVYKDRIIVIINNPNLNN